MNHIRSRNQGCPKCGGSKKLTIEDIKKYFEENRDDLIILSNTYVNYYTKMKWQCRVNNHIFFSSICSIKSNGAGCPECASKALTFNDVKEFVNERKDIIMISIEYITSAEQMKWQCSDEKCNHIWSTTFSSIKSGSSCPKCATSKKKYNIDSIKNHITEKKLNITLLSNIYNNVKEKLLWKCNKCSDEWKTNLDTIINAGSGCPNCSSYKTEKLCRTIITNITNLKYQKKKPKFLNGLELDGYNKDLQITFEYNGPQHYKYIPHFHRNGIKDFLSQHLRDRLKKHLCKINGVELIIIPYIYDYRDEDKLYNFIYNDLDKKGKKGILNII